MEQLTRVIITLSFKTEKTKIVAGSNSMMTRLEISTILRYQKKHSEVMIAILPRISMRCKHRIMANLTQL
jgi:hypothetical protein